MTGEVRQSPPSVRTSAGDVQFRTDAPCRMVSLWSMEQTIPSSGLMIPGERERNTLTHRLPGSIGGPEFGSDVGGTPSVLMDAITIAEHQREGGGAPRTRRAG